MSNKKTQKNRTREWQKKRTLVYMLPDTKENLKKYGQMGDTYDDVISNLMAFAKEFRKKYDTFIRER